MNFFLTLQHFFNGFGKQRFPDKTCFPSSLIFFFQLMRFFLRKDFQRNVEDSIQMPEITKRNSNVHLIFGNTGLVVT